VCQALVSGKAPGMTDTTRTLQDVLDGMRFAMVATADGAGIWKSRPLALAGDQADVLSFLVSVDADWVTALEDSGSPTTVTLRCKATPARLMTGPVPRSSGTPGQPRTSTARTTRWSGCST